MSTEKGARVRLENPYLEQVWQNLPRLLALFDDDRTSRSFGMGDRYFWAWGLIDFGNGTFQGAAHGLARLWRHGLWPHRTSKDAFLTRLDSLFHATAELTAADGSLQEAFPGEGSYCVTALVAFDLLCALELMGAEIDAELSRRWQKVVAPLISYLLNGDETHALISNHLATAVAALVRWHQLTTEANAERRARELLDRILNHQSEEGWFKEYEGADPGYQSLCMYYLADVHRLRPDWSLLEPLRRSIRFLWHFAHPDGSFAGVYGSRCTRFYYPAGIRALAGEIPEAATLAEFMERSIADSRVVTLSAIDEPNLVPTFNCYCWAAALSKTEPFSEAEADLLLLPALDPTPLRRHYTEAGLFLDRGARHYTVVSSHKGGVLYHFLDGRAVVKDAGVVVRNPKGALGSSQSYRSSNDCRLNDETLQVQAPFVPMPKQLPSPLQFIVLRLLCVSVFRVPALRDWVKRLLVRLLITGGRAWPAENIRTIHLGENLNWSDKQRLPQGYRRVPELTMFVPIHMASQGYWQIQDEEESA